MSSIVSVAVPDVTCAACARIMAPATPGLDRRTVSILFLDIVGFTAIVDGLCPEDVRDMQIAYFSAASRVVRANGGVVEKYVGDAVMAVFGADGGDGHDAYRAVQAGLHLQELLDGCLLAGRFPVRTRVGIATGEVLVDATALRDGGYAMVSGSVVTTAARLQAYAPHGTVVVCAYTRYATASMVAYQDLPPVGAPGKARPIELWRALPRRMPRRGDAPDRRPSHRVISGRISGCGDHPDGTLGPASD